MVSQIFFLQAEKEKGRIFYFSFTRPRRILSPYQHFFFDFFVVFFAFLWTMPHVIRLPSFQV
jgi:hypothetical protein